MDSVEIGLWVTGGMLFAAPNESLTALIDALKPSRDVRGAYVRTLKAGSVAAA